MVLPERLLWHSHQVLSDASTGCGAEPDFSAPMTNWTNRHGNTKQVGAVNLPLKFDRGI